MPNDDNKIILEFPATNVEIELGETITFDNISGFLDSERVTYNGDSLTEIITHLEDDKADTTYVNTELDKKADKTDTYTKSQVDTIANRKMNSANPTGTGSIAVGSNMLNAGVNSQTFGKNTKAFNQNTFAAGEGTTAGSNNQFVFGRYNQEDWRDQYVEIVGNGTNGHSSNARTLDWQGNETLAGNLTFNGNKSLTSEISRLDGRIDTKANASDVYTKSQTDNLLNGKANASDVYTKQTTDALLNDKADVSDLPDMSQYYDKSEVDDLLDDKANSDDVYDKAYIDTALSGKANVGTSYTKSEEDALLANKADKSDTYTKEQVDDIVYNILPDDTASGSVANFTTSLELPIKSLEVDVNAVQNAGTPTPASPLPISGWSEISLVNCGANLWDEVWELGTINNQTGQNADDSGMYRSKNYIQVPQGVNLYLVNGNSDTLGLRFYDSNKNFISARAFLTSKAMTYGTNDLPTGTAYIRFVNTSTNVYLNNIAINYPSSDNAYHAFNGTTEVVNLGGTYYGGHFTQDKAGHRQFEVTHGIYAFDGTENFGALSSNNRVYTNILSDAYIPSVSTEKCVISTHYVGTSQNQATSGAVYKTTGNLALVFQDDVNGVDVATFRAFLANQYASNTPVTVVYKIATPYTIDLPDGEPITTAIGTNNIYADTGDASVVFKNSVNGYVEKKIASVQALALNT